MKELLVVKHYVGRLTSCRLRTLAGMAVAAFVLGSSVAATCGTTPIGNSGLQRLLTPENIVHFVRVRWQIPESVLLTAGTVRPSNFQEFYETTVSADAGARHSEEKFFITRDGRCFISNPVFPLTGRTRQDVVRCVQRAAKLPASAKITLGAFERSAFPGLLKASVRVEEASKAASGHVFITADRKAAILGAVLPFSPKFVEQLIDTKGQPDVGPSNARVTIVEYTDLECPYCARFQRFLDQQFLPQYGREVRVIFKEFPLSKHPWSMSAAIANECAYQIDPPAFLRFRALIFASQDEINLANVRDKLLVLGEESGINRLELATCMDSGASRPRVEADLREVENLSIMFLPTLFVNGRITVNPSPEIFEQLVNQELKRATQNE